MAAGLLRWASSRREPYRALRNYARKHGTGHYRPRSRKPAYEEEYARHLAFITRRDREKRELRGWGLSQSDREDLAREFYAPSHRAEMHRAQEREDAA